MTLHAVLPVTAPMFIICALPVPNLMILSLQHPIWQSSLMLMYSFIMAWAWNTGLTSITETLNGSDVIITEASKDVPSVTENYDPHVWLDPENAAKEYENIANALILADPDNRGYYTARLDEVLSDLDKLDDDYKSAVAGFKSHNIITSHEAYMNLCDAYGLIQLAVNGVDNSEDPTPTRMAEIEDFIKANDIKYVFTEPLSTSKIIQTIADDTGCEITYSRSV